MFLFCKVPFSLLLARPYIRICIPRARSSLTYIRIYLIFLSFLSFVPSFARSLLNYRFIHLIGLLVLRFAHFLCIFINAYMSRSIFPVQHKNQKLANFYDHVNKSPKCVALPRIGYYQDNAFFPLYIYSIYIVYIYIDTFLNAGFFFPVIYKAAIWLLTLFPIDIRLELKT